MKTRIMKTTALSVALAATVIGSPTQAQSTLPPVTLTFYYPGPGAPKDLRLVQDAVNAITSRKINATLELHPTDYGSWGQKMDLMLNSGQQCDMVFTSFWTGSGFARYAANGALAPLDDLLAKYAPKLFARYSKDTWRAAQVGGKTYAVVHISGYPAFTGVQVLKNLADKYNLNVAKVRTLDDLTPFLAAVKKGEPGVTPMLPYPRGVIFSNEISGFDQLVDPMAVRYNDKTLRIINMYATPEFQHAATLIRSWYQAGYLPKDAVTADDSDAQYKAGKYAVWIRNFDPSSAIEVKQQFNQDVVGKSLSPLFKGTNAISNTMNAICASSKNKERAMMFYDLIQQDKLLFNTLAYGVQGTHWDWSDASKSSIKFIGDPANSGYNPGTSWAFGGNHQLDTYPIASETPQQKAALQASVKLQLSAKASVALGFVLDAGPIKSELAQIAAVLKQYRDPLMAGLVDPKVAVPDLNRRLQQAGLDRVMAETQRQINAWKKSQ